MKFLYSVDIMFVCYTVFFINMVHFLVSLSMFSFSASSYASDMHSKIPLCDTNSDAEENRRNVSLRALVFMGMKNFSIDL